MHKVLIVDDDEIMCEGTRKNIKWEEHDLTIVATAANGMEALELIRETKPNIVLSDIRMPFMDGLQMVEKINEVYPWIKVVLLTGFDDFEYAKKALKLKVCEYVLKYEDDEEILKAVLKARDELVMQKNINEKLEKSKSLMINKFLCDLMYGIGSDELADNSAALSGITFRGKMFCVAVISVDDWQMFYNCKETKNFDLLLFSIQNICNEILEWYGLGIYCNNYQQRINILFSFTEQDKDIQSYVLKVLEDLLENLEKYLKIKISIGVGKEYGGYGSIPASFNEAAMALEMKVVLGKSGIIFSDTIRNNASYHQVLLNKIIDFVNKNYYKEELSLKEIANEVHIAPTYISTLFKKHNEINFNEYLTDIRLKKAMELFQNTDLKSYEIGEKVGYSNPQYFSILFKKYTGFTTKEYKNMINSKE